MKSGKWVMILDNADDKSVFFDSPGGAVATGESAVGISQTQPLSKFIPQSDNGVVLITTRDMDAAFRFTGRNKDIIKVEPMNQADALGLLEKKLGVYFECEGGQELSKALDYMPLAITQAAAYIYQRAPRSSIAKYIKDLTKSDKTKAALLSHDTGDLRRDLSASNSIIVTWQISFDHIRMTRPSAADLLSLMSFFDRQGIPEDLLHGEQKKDTSPTSAEESDDDTRVESGEDEEDSFEEDIAVLRAFSLDLSDPKRLD
jgi:hypothetical protein